MNGGGGLVKMTLNGRSVIGTAGQSVMVTADTVQSVFTVLDGLGEGEVEDKGHPDGLDMNDTDGEGLEVRSTGSIECR